MGSRRTARPVGPRAAAYVAGAALLVTAAIITAVAVNTGRQQPAPNNEANSDVG